jgi:hypothetical protein
MKMCLRTRPAIAFKLLVVPAPMRAKGFFHPLDESQGLSANFLVNQASFLCSVAGSPPSRSLRQSLIAAQKLLIGNAPAKWSEARRGVSGCRASRFCTDARDPS